jgi:hypothetical protein
MTVMEQIIAAVVGGIFVIGAFGLGQFAHFITAKKRKMEDLANLIIPRRAELCREFFRAVAETGIQMLADEGGMPKDQKIRELHDLCNRSMYALCPYGSLKFLECIQKLSEICYTHKPDVLAEKEGAWKQFKMDFMSKFLEMPALARTDCFGPDIDKLMGQEVKAFVAVSGIAAELRVPARTVKERLRKLGIQPDKQGLIPRYYRSVIERVLTMK